MSRERSDLERRRKEWVDAVNRRDVAGYADILAEGIVWIPPGQEPVVGRDAFKSWVSPFFERFHYDFAVHDEQIRMAGDRAVERARFTTSMTPMSGGETMTHAGSYFALWHRSGDGIWRIERYVDVTDLVKG